MGKQAAKLSASSGGVDSSRCILLSPGIRIVCRDRSFCSAGACVRATRDRAVSHRITRTEKTCEGLTVCNRTRVSVSGIVRVTGDGDDGPHTRTTTKARKGVTAAARVPGSKSKTSGSTASSITAYAISTSYRSDRTASASSINAYASSCSSCIAIVLGATVSASSSRLSLPSNKNESKNRDENARPH